MEKNPNHFIMIDVFNQRVMKINHPNKFFVMKKISIVLVIVIFIFSDSLKAQWIYMGFGNESVHAIVIHPSNPDIIFAAGNELYKSINGGISWDTVSYQGTTLTPTQNGIYRSWGCSDNIAYFVTDTEYFVFDGNLGTWQTLAITTPAGFGGIGPELAT